MVETLKKTRYRDPEKQKIMGRERYRQWRIRYPERELEKQNRRRRSPSGRLIKNIRNRFKEVLRGERKAGRTVDLIGCSLEELRSWLSGWFEPGMTWENYGKIWHIDHRRPCVSFDMALPEEQKRCFNYLNLQPLFAADNFSKGDRWSVLA